MNKILCIVGPTASGKTALAVRAAHALNGEVVSCDSVQIYKGFDIGSAKPPMEERQGVPHHMLDVAAPEEQWSAGRYAEAARACVGDILARGKTPIVCGGTGLYLRALLGGLDGIPAAPRRVYGEGAYEFLCRVDPKTAGRLAPGDRKRVERALDVWHATGKPLSSFLGAPKEPLCEPVTVGILSRRRREEIASRARAMMGIGLIEETAVLLLHGVPENCPPMNAIGYVQARAVLRGAMTLEKALDEIILRTAQYAKRQMTWFRNQTSPHWLERPSYLDADAEALEKFWESAVKTIEILWKI